MIDDRQALSTKDFRVFVRDHYRMHGRHNLPWRVLPAAGSAVYPVLVSEMMLQQTQVSRVIPKYLEFLEIFPTVEQLAAAASGDVLRAWSGLGYNRRAKFLHQTAQIITQEYGGNFPDRLEELVKLPGVGINTAGAIQAYAFNQPAIFVETNIRTVFIHHYFNDSSDVPDSAILELVTETLDTEHPREWYWALMDYGSWLKQSVGNLGQQSKSYSRQSRFAGSRRQIRGQVIRLLGDQPLTFEQLQKRVPDYRLSSVVDELMAEQLIRSEDTTYLL